MIYDIDKNLIKKAKKGNIKAFEKLIIKHEKTAYNIAYRIFNNEEDAKDMAQESFIKVYKSINKFEENSNFKTWLYRIVTNTCLDELRKRKGKSTESIDSEIMTEDSSISKEIRDNNVDIENDFIAKEQGLEVKYAIHKLKDDYKIALILKDVQGFKYEEISEILDCSLSTAKTRVRRARINLREILNSSKPFYDNQRQITRKEDTI